MPKEIADGTVIETPPNVLTCIVLKGVDLLVSRSSPFYFFQLEIVA